MSINVFMHIQNNIQMFKYNTLIINSNLITIKSSDINFCRLNHDVKVRQRQLSQKLKALCGKMEYTAK